MPNSTILFLMFVGYIVIMGVTFINFENLLIMRKKVHVSQTCGFIFLLTMVILKIVVYDDDMVLNKKNLFQMQWFSLKDCSLVQMASIILLQWLLFVMKTPVLVNEIVELQKISLEQSKVIQENEVHAASLVHELRQPLNSLLGTITLLEKSTVSKSHQVIEVFGMAKSCGEHLKTLIGNLLEYSKLKAKKIEINKSSIDLRANIIRILKMNFIKSQERQNNLLFFFSTNFPKKVITDEQRLNQVLINLISNALKFTEKGSVSVYLGWRAGFTNVESQAYQDSIKQNPIHYTEQKHLFQHLENIEEEEEQHTYRHGQSYESLSQNEGGTIKHVSSLDHPNKFSIQNDTDLIRIQSNFDLDNVSARDFMRSSSDHQPSSKPVKTTKNVMKNHDLASFFIQPESFKNYKSDMFRTEQVMLNQDVLSNPSFNKQAAQHVNPFQNVPPGMIEFDDKKSMDAMSSNQYFENYVDQFLLEDQEPAKLDDADATTPEEYADTLQHPHTVRKSTVSRREHLDQPFDRSNEDRYGTPKQDVSESQKALIDRVVNRHKKAAQSIFTELHPIGSSFIDEILSSRRDGLDITLHSFKEQLEKTEKKAKFISTCGSNPLVQKQDRAHSIQRIKEERKGSIFSKKADDDQLLEQSIGRYKKQRDLRKTSSQLLNESHSLSQNIDTHSKNERQGYDVAQDTYPHIQVSINSNDNDQNQERDLADIRRGGCGGSQLFPSNRTGAFGNVQTISTPANKDRNTMRIQGMADDLFQEQSNRLQIKKTPQPRESQTRFDQFQQDIQKFRQENFKTIQEEEKKGPTGDKQTLSIHHRNISFNISNEDNKFNVLMETQQNVIFETPFMGKDELSKRTQDKRMTLELEKPSFAQDPVIGSTLLVPEAKTQQKRSKTQKKINIRVVGLDSQDDLSIQPTMKPLEQSQKKHHGPQSFSGKKTEEDMTLVRVTKKDKESPVKLNLDQSSNQNDMINTKFETRDQIMKAEVINDVNKSEEETSKKTSTRKKALKLTVGQLEKEQPTQKPQIQVQEQSKQNVWFDSVKDITFSGTMKQMTENANLFQENSIKKQTSPQNVTDLPLQSKSAPIVHSNLHNNSETLIQKTYSNDEIIERSLTMMLPNNSHQTKKQMSMGMTRFSTLAFPHPLQTSSFSPGNEHDEQSRDQFTFLNDSNMQMCSQEKGVVEIKVRDSGIGISEQGLKKLFKPYGQADKNIQKNYGGTGLGLCICYELIQCMNGKITVSSDLGIGTEFIVSIPMEVSAEVTTLIDEAEFDKEINEGELMNYEFVVCNNERSFGIQQLRKIFIKKQTNIYFKEPRDLINIDANTTFFQLERTYKAFVLDYQSIRQNRQNLLQTLSTQNDLVKVDTNALLGKQQTPSESGISYTVVSIKVPVIVLISALTDESKIKKSENIFILRVPFDAKSVKKILIFLKKYYLACINQLKPKFKHSAFFQGAEEGKTNSREEIHNNNDSLSQVTDKKDQSSSRSMSHHQITQGPVKSEIVSNNEDKNVRQTSQKEGQLNHIHSLQRSNSNKTSLIAEKEGISTPMATYANKRKNTTMFHQHEDGNDSNRLFYQKSVVNLNTKNIIPFSKMATGDLSPDHFTKGLLSNRSNQSYNKSRALHSQAKQPPPLQLHKINGISHLFQDQYALVVNDDPFTLRITSMILDCCREECGKIFTILTASDGKEAVDYYMQMSNIKLILMDVHMRVMDGYEATKKIREYEESLKCTKNGCQMTYIIGVSGNSDQMHFRQCQNSGMNEAVVTPITNEKIKELINQLF